MIKGMGQTYDNYIREKIFWDVVSSHKKKIQYKCAKFINDLGCKDMDEEINQTYIQKYCEEYIDKQLMVIFNAINCRNYELENLNKENEMLRKRIEELKKERSFNNSDNFDIVHGLIWVGILTWLVIKWL
jgi:hypothetical protein